VKVIFISGALPSETLELYNAKYAKRKVRNVQQWWDYTFATNLKNACGDENFYAISFPPVSTFPSSKCLYHKKRQINTKDGMKIFIPSTINLAYFKQKTLISSIKKTIRKIVKQNQNEDVVILTHCIYLQSAIPAKKAKKYKNVKICTIVPDLPEHSTANALKQNKILRALYNHYTKKTLPYKYVFDGYVCFSRWQMEHLNKEKPFIVMEGFMDVDKFKGIEKCSDSNDKFNIVYAGGISYRYGIKELVDGFISANLKDAILTVYGDGDAVEYLKGKEEFGVYYGGLVSREEVLKIEKSASLLINPRPTTDEYSRCSFPSKLMEYMASGTPVLTTKLGCIEEEYYDKLYFIDNLSKEGVSKAISLVYSDYENAKMKGKKASEYIANYKNASCQAKKVYEFLLSITKGK
jgi:glycosyltransferase involved in cell wall biosynthesis